MLVTDEDAREVSRLDPSLRTATIPNALMRRITRRANAFRRPRDPLHRPRSTHPPTSRPHCASPERILPLVRRTLPDATLTLVGRSPAPRRARAGAASIADVPDLRPYLWGAAVYACPMESGTGIKNKLLEAISGVTYAKGLGPTSCRFHHQTPYTSIKLLIYDQIDQMLTRLVAHGSHRERDWRPAGGGTESQHSGAKRCLIVPANYRALRVPHSGVMFAQPCFLPKLFRNEIVIVCWSDARSIVDGALQGWVHAISVPTTAGCWEKCKVEPRATGKELL